MIPFGAVDVTEAEDFLVEMNLADSVEPLVFQPFDERINAVDLEAEVPRRDPNWFSFHHKGADADPRH